MFTKKQQFARVGGACHAGVRASLVLAILAVPFAPAMAEVNSADVVAVVYTGLRRGTLRFQPAIRQTAARNGVARLDYSRLGQAPLAFIDVDGDGRCGVDEPQLEVRLPEPSSGVATVLAFGDSDRDSDSLPDYWEKKHFENLNAAPGQDPDGDSCPNIQEYFADTDPNRNDRQEVVNWREAVAKLRLVGRALAACDGIRPGAGWTLPDSLDELVERGILERDVLVCGCDPYEGEQGGFPDSYTVSRVLPDADVPGTSFFFEFSDRTFTRTKVRTSGGDVHLTWREWKKRQFKRMRKTTKEGENTPKCTRGTFPVVRLFWIGYPAFEERVGHGELPMTVLNLALDFETVFASEDAWERSYEREVLGLRDLATVNLHIPKNATEVLVPLWSHLTDVGKVAYVLDPESSTGDGVRIFDDFLVLGAPVKRQRVLRGTVLSKPAEGPAQSRPYELRVSRSQ